jgi:hypothetical protein
MVAELQVEQKAKVEDLVGNGAGHETVFVDQFVDGILDPNRPMLGPVRDGGHIITNTAPGCWGPMITPAIRGGHEVTQPVAVAGAEVGDAIAIRIKNITVTSLATSSGNDQWMQGRSGRPYRRALPGAGRCEAIKGISRNRYAALSAAPPFTSGYTVASTTTARWRYWKRGGGNYQRPALRTGKIHSKPV